MIIDIVLGKAIGRGGLEEVLTLVSNELKSRGHRVRVCQFTKPDYTEWENTLPEIYYYAQNQSYYKGDGTIEIKKLALGYRNLIAKIGKPDIVLATHTPLFSLICRYALDYIEYDSPSIISWLHGPPEAYGGEELLKFSDAHFAISQSISDKIKKIEGNKNKIHYIGNPVDIKKKGIINRPSSYKKFLYIGRLNNHEKRIDVLFNALEKLQGNWELRIIGDGPSKDELYSLAFNLGINQRIIWDGWKDNPWEEVKEASLLILSSDYEGFGLVLIESLVRGIPVVSTNCDGPNEIIQEGLNGWTYPIGDYKALNNILQDILTGNLQLPNEKDCRESVIQYSPKVVVETIEEILITYFSKKEIREKLGNAVSLSDEEVAMELFNMVDRNHLNIEAIFSVIDNQISDVKKSKWLTGLGVLFWENQLFDNIIPTFQKAIDYDQNNNDALFNLGVVLLDLGEHEMGLNYLEKIINKDKETLELIYNIKAGIIN